MIVLENLLKQIIQQCVDNKLIVFYIMYFNLAIPTYGKNMLGLYKPKTYSVYLAYFIISSHLLMGIFFANRVCDSAIPISEAASNENTILYTISL